MVSSPSSSPSPSPSASSSSSSSRSSMSTSVIESTRQTSHGRSSPASAACRSSSTSSSITSRGTGSTAPLASSALQHVSAAASVLKHTTESVALTEIEKYCASAVPTSCTSTHTVSTAGSTKSSDVLPSYMSSGTSVTAIVTAPGGGSTPLSRMMYGSSAAEVTVRSPEKTIATRKSASC